MLRRIYNKRLLLLLSSTCLVACDLSFVGLELHRGRGALKKKDYKSAIQHFRKVILRDPTAPRAIEAAREAARVSLFETKQFAEAVEFYKHLIQYSESEGERREAQGKIAEIYFEKLVDYKKAIEEYNKLLLLRNANEEIVEYRFNLGRAHFYLNDFREAQTEVEVALKISENKERNFDLMMFLGNIYFNTKRADLAIKVYQEILDKYPDRAKKDNVAMNISVCYEELEAFDSAIERLISLRATYHDPKFIDLKIKRLRERKSNLPGSKGLRK